MNKLARRTVDRAIHNANKQIAQTKNYLNMQNAKGLLFIANDGNMHLSHWQFLNTIVKVLDNKEASSNIDAFIYFTINVVAYNNEDNHLHHMWYPMHKTKNSDEFHFFIRQLSDSFLNEFLPKYTGTPVHPIDSTDNPIEGMKEITKLKYFPKDMIFKNKQK